MSIVLLLGALYGVLIAAMLFGAPKNKIANRFLALLLIVFAMRLTPYVIGYAGYYDAYPWLSFAPYDASLAFGPLLYFYVRALTGEPLQQKWWKHFLPVAIQLTYYCVIFAFPLDFKNRWDGNVHVPIIDPLEKFATLISIAAYWWASLKQYRSYQTWLGESVSYREDFHLEWVRNFLIALGATLVIWAGFIGFEALIAKLNYFQRFPFYVWLVIVVYYLGTEGYRNAQRSYPNRALLDEARPLQILEPEKPSELPTPPPNLANSPATTPSAEQADRDWKTIGEKWKALIIKNEWWRDPELNLAQCAKHLGTNTSHLSRAINDGLGQNFNELINGLRIHAVKAQLCIPGESRDVLEIAFAAGFSSKASFNRSFKFVVGVTPTAFRAGTRRDKDIAIIADSGAIR
jgi:AraC-like DNA-binding protein